MSTSSHSPLVYVDCDIPDGMTLVEWRAMKDRAERRSRQEASEARSQARRSVLKRRLPRLGLRPQPSFRPRFA
jgi:hypothetical protein